MESEEKPKASKHASMRVYGASGSTVNNGIDTIMGIHPGGSSIHSKETGTVTVKSEIYTQLGGSSGCSGSWGGGGGEGDLLCYIIVAIIMTVFAVVWSVVMIAFSIVTIGGFIKRRYRTIVIVGKENIEFIGKLLVLVARRGGVSDYTLGNAQYDEWKDDTFGLFMRLKHLRQGSLLLAFGWGLIEIGFKLNQILFDPTDYYLWPFRYVMIAVFAPLIFYSPVLEMTIRGKFDEGEDILARLVMNEPRYNPDMSMDFEQKPVVGESLPASLAKE
ncbi:MAG: hypothetical protein ACW975_02890 [Candidatus Thorarchaeota archaeon]